MSINSVAGSNYEDYRSLISLGKIFIPSDVNRDIFVANCLRLGTVSVVSQGETPLHNVYCLSHVLQTIEFPTTSNATGSVVLYVKDEAKNEYFVVGTLKGSVQILQETENAFTILKKDSDGTLLFSMVPAENMINVAITGNKPGKFLINLASENSELNVKINGNVKLESDDVLIQSPKTFTGDENASVETDNVQKKVTVTADEFIVGSGEQQVLLGNLFLEIMDKFIQEVADSTIKTATGQMPLFNKEKILEYKELFSDTVSKIVKID